MNEMELLCKTLKIDVQISLAHNLKKIHPSTYISADKAKEIIDKCKMLNCENIILNEDISASQIKNLQKEAE